MLPFSARNIHRLALCGRMAGVAAQCRRRLIQTSDSQQQQPHMMAREWYRKQYPQQKRPAWGMACVAVPPAHNTECLALSAAISNTYRGPGLGCCRASSTHASTHGSPTQNTGGCFNGQGPGDTDPGPERREAPLQSPHPVEATSLPPGATLRTFFPWMSVIELVPPCQLRERVTVFSSHSGLLYALMASISTAGLLWDPVETQHAIIAASHSTSTSCSSVGWASVSGLSLIYSAPT